MSLTIDPASKRIILDSASVTATEIYSRVTDWQALSDNLKYGLIIRQVGSDDLGGGLSIPPYYFLQDSWRVRPMESNHTLIITGNLFVEGGGVPVVNTLGAYNVAVQYTVPVQAQGIATSGSTGPTAESIAAAVWQRAIEDGMSGEQMLRIMFSALAGVTSGVGSNTERYMALDGVTPRIEATFDANNNRTSITLDGA